MANTKCLCGKGRPVEYVDEVTQRGYCSVCASSEVTSSLAVHMQFISDLVPLEVGERVECRTVGEYYDGTGVIVEISTELRHGGTPVHPAYRVRLDGEKGEELWYTPVCLTRTARVDARG
ncbi:hypothetical protein SEA_REDWATTLEHOG_10 [Gordonia phage RedWattleHog]|uniref:Uncharacterized protein n=1 Tax=Gordonia phage Stormageddon TaxID=2656541 RepID=A0A649VTI3_9CAUD|nr:hypothetical protein KHQ86_gp010 [Gordonia phage Stormageddon]QGJ94873.1 hypothetical protein SEA_STORMAGEDDON_10 [Gordonia phage Stormageddon]QLF83514.1 hypothetical protein SEA_REDWATTLEHOG_10 [Gordonia phage RedWattleHog]